ncbi:MAG: hypothetical protein RLZZ621_2043 [Gemmatimonadota bacterium]|jgi:hypothetical protein
MTKQLTIAMAAVLAMTAAPLTAQTSPVPTTGGQVVGVNGISTLGNTTNWSPKILGPATAQVTTTYPCGTQPTANTACSGGYGNVGTGSLELGVTGNPWGPVADQYGEWAFYRYRPEGGIGSLSALTNLSFDWYRAYVPGWDAAVGSIDNTDPTQPIPPLDWRYKTPVFQIELAEERNGVTYRSMLVWEGYYNQSRLTGEGNTTPIDTWVRQEALQRDNFWYVRLDPNPDAVGIYGKGSGCSESMSFWEGTAQGNGIQMLQQAGGCLSGVNAYITGIGVGVGSQWPLEWRGAVDNIRVGMNGAEYLNTNFDFVPQSAVPEPSTYALMGAGLLAMAAMARRRRPVDAATTAPTVGN